MKELNLREIQLGELEVLKKVDQICRENNFEYYLQYGTLIGAIRHKGFIPWDDDIDVVMPRESYERFIKWMTEHKEEIKPFELMHYSVNKDYIYPIARVSDSRYLIEYKDAKNYGLGLFVDIYPMDGWGNSYEEAAQLHQSLDTITKLVRLAGVDHFVPSPLGKARSVTKHLMYNIMKLTGPRFFVRMLDRKGLKYKYDDYDVVGCLIWANTPKAAVMRRCFEPMTVEFEGCEFIAPKGYDEILTRTYGDYMKLPPAEEQIAHHYYSAYRK